MNTFNFRNLYWGFKDEWVVINSGGVYRSENLSDIYPMRDINFLPVITYFTIRKEIEGYRVFYSFDADKSNWKEVKLENLDKFLKDYCSTKS